MSVQSRNYSFSIFRISHIGGNIVQVNELGKTKFSSTRHVSLPVNDTVDSVLMPLALLMVI
jgi:hypothetical protein